MAPRKVKGGAAAPAGLPPNIAMFSNVQKGWLCKAKKKSISKMNAWKKRYFLLHGFALYYFKSPEDVPSHILGVISLNGREDVQITRSNTTQECKHPHSLKVISKKETMYLHAESEDDINKWAQLMQQAWKNSLEGDALPATGAAKPGEPSSGVVISGMATKGAHINSVKESWKRRYFVVCRRKLIYADSQDSYPNSIRGEIDLKGATVERVPPDECKQRNCIRVITADRTLWAHFDSDEETSTWLEVLQDQTRPSLPLFGVSLSDLTTRSDTARNTPIPLVVRVCCEWLWQNGATSTEGIFREAGSNNQINHFMTLFNEGEDVIFPKSLDPHIVSGILKKYLRDLPEPLFRFENYLPMIEAVLSEKEDHIVHTLCSLIMDHLSPFEQTTMNAICFLLKQIELNHQATLMLADNLGIVFGPVLFRGRSSGTVNEIHTVGCNIKAASTLIRHYYQIFDKFCNEPYLNDFYPGAIPVKENQKQTDIAIDTTPENSVNILSWVQCEQSNDKCADCGSNAPNYVDLHLRVFICIHCSAVHRALVQQKKIIGVTDPSRVIKSTDGEWTAQELFSLQSPMIRNNISNTYWEATILEFEKILPADPFTMKERFCINKYVLYKWVDPQEVPPPGIPAISAGVGANSPIRTVSFTFGSSLSTPPSILSTSSNDDSPGASSPVARASSFTDGIRTRAQRAQQFETNKLRKEGWITKQGGGHKTWHRRWLELRGNLLSYYKKQNPPATTITPPPKGGKALASQTAVGQIVIDEQTVVEVAHESASVYKQKNVFILKHPKMRDYPMSAETVGDMCAWIEALRAAIWGCKFKQQGGGGVSTSTSFDADDED